MNIDAIADEVDDAYARRRPFAATLTTREGFDLDAAYAVEAELTRRRRASGRRTVGRKVGYASKALWRALKLDTLVWAHMYDDTVMPWPSRGPLPLARMCSPRIEPEIVLKLARPIEPGAQDASAILPSVEWVALGFEIVDSVFADWKFQPADFVAAYGLHAALAVGPPLSVTSAAIPALAEQLAQFRLRLARNGEVVAEGSGRNSLRSPALCLGELATAIAKRQPDEPLAAGEIVSSGSLTEALSLHPGETWTASVEGIGLPDLSLQTA